MIVVVEILVLLLLDAEKYVLEPVPPDFRMMVRQGRDAPEPYHSGNAPYPVVLSSNFFFFYSPKHFAHRKSKSWSGTTGGREEMNDMYALSIFPKLLCSSASYLAKSTAVKHDIDEHASSGIYHSVVGQWRIARQGQCLALTSKYAMHSINPYHIVRGGNYLTSSEPAITHFAEQFVESRPCGQDGPYHFGRFHDTVL